MDRESDFLSDVFKIALGIVLGGIILWICSESYARYRINQAVTAFAQAAAEISNGMDDAQRRARERQEAERRARQERARLEQMRRSAAVREAADRERARQRAEAAKEAAWAAFYQPSVPCGTRT